MKKPLLLSLVLATQLVMPVQACDISGKTGLLPENNLYIPADEKGLFTINEGEFNEVLDRIESLYTSIVKSKGGNLKLERNWEDGTVNAYASQEGRTWKVAMFGGLARHDTITKDGFALVACHELGHHIGGAPKKKSFFGYASWATNEGQADYFGTLKCLREYFSLDDNQAIVAQMEIDPVVTTECQKSFSDAEDLAICKRGGMAGLSLAKLFRSIRNQETPVLFNTPDRSVVSSTYDGHPDSQCRLDTYFAGAICPVDKSEEVSDTDETRGTCHKANGHDRGLRPLCWFKPKVSLL